MSDNLPPLPEPTGVLAEVARGETLDEMRRNVSHEFRDAGDARLMWVNEGSLALHRMHLASLASAVAERDAEIGRLRASYEGACKLVADMHSAAMGARVGPASGVVEDVLALRRRAEEVEALRADAERYQGLRKFNPRQFADLWQRNIAGEGRFDALVDDAIDRARGQE